MRAKDLLLKLIDIERAIGVEEPFKVREMVMQAQECLLAIQKSLADQLPQERLAPATVSVLAANDYVGKLYKAERQDLLTPGRG